MNASFKLSNDFLSIENKKDCWLTPNSLLLSQELKYLALGQNDT